jgi:small subunit ribosomal protein S16
MGRRHRPFFRICAMDQRSPRDGKVIEELGYYDPMVPDADARTVLKNDRVDYWLGVGAQPTPKVGVLIKKYGTNGTHLEQQEAARERIRLAKPVIPPPPAPPAPPKQEETAPAEESAESATPAESADQETQAEGTETPAAESGE